MLQVMDECLLSLPKQKKDDKAKMLLEFVRNLVQESTKGESPSFNAFSRLMKDKRVCSTSFYFCIFFLYLFFLFPLNRLSKLNSTSTCRCERMTMTTKMTVPWDASYEFFRNCCLCHLPIRATMLSRRYLGEKGRAKRGKRARERRKRRN